MGRREGDGEERGRRDGGREREGSKGVSER